MEVYLAGLIDNGACFFVLGCIIYGRWCMVIQPEIYNRHYHFAIAYRGDIFLFNSTICLYIYLCLPKLLHKMGNGHAINAHRLQPDHHFFYLNTDILPPQVIHPGNLYVACIPGDPVPVYL